MTMKPCTLKGHSRQEVVACESFEGSERKRRVELHRIRVSLGRGGILQLFHKGLDRLHV